MSNTLSGYVNRPVSDVMAELGQPDFVYDTGPNDRTYMWKDTRATSPSPTVIDSNSHIGDSGKILHSTTTIQPSEQTTYQCNYAVYARKVKPDAVYLSDWVVVGYKKPSLNCE